MRICMICEGSYPYIAGGVSGWVQMIVEAFSDVEFIIWSIATSRAEMNTYRYNLPDNVVEVKTIYLAEKAFQDTKRRIRLTTAEKAALKVLLSSNINQNISWTDTLALFSKYQNRLADLLMCKDFYDIAVSIYCEDYERVGFSSFLWNMRSMYFPLASAMSSELPKADIYHSVSTGYAGILGSIASFIENKPLLITEHGIYTREREEEIIKSDWVSSEFKSSWMSFFNKLSQIAYYSAKEVLTLFETNRQLEIELGCPPEKIHIIPNGIDIAAYDSLKSMNKISHENFNIGVVARVVPIKDIKTMLYAMEVAVKQNKKLTLYILGPTEEDDEYCAECLQLVSELGLQNVFFLGRVDIKEYLPDLDAMLLTSISEGQPLAVLEGMAAYLPQICTNVGSCSDLLKGFGEDVFGDAGIIVPIMDIVKIAAAILKLASDSSLCTLMGKIGHKRVSKYYQKKAFLDQYYNLYQKYNEGRGEIWQESDLS